MKKVCLLISALSMLAVGTQAQILSGTGGDYALMPVSDTNKISLTDKAAGYSLTIYDDGGADGDYSGSCDGYMLLTAPEGSRIILRGEMDTESGYDRVRIYNGANSKTNLIGTYSGTNKLDIRSSGSQLFLYFHSDYGYQESGFAITATIFTPFADGDFEYTDAKKTELMGYSGSAESVTIPNSVQRIDDESFMNCTTLKTVVVGDSVKYIGVSAFIGCTNLETINIPASVMFVGSDAFYQCDSLKSVTIESFAELEDAGLYITKDSIRYEIYQKNHAKVAKRFYSGDVVIPASFTAGNTFEVSIIGEEAFQSCSALTSVTIPEGVEIIGSYAFGYCENLKAIEIPKSVKNIKSHAFHGTSLKSITIPSTVTDVAYNAFTDCDSLTSVTIETNADISSAGLSFTKDGFRYDVLSRKEAALGRGNYSGDFVVPTTVTAGNTFTITGIGDHAFYGCKSLKSVTIPAGITSIGSSAFHNCDSLASIVIPEGVTKIGSEAFYNCDTLSSVTIPEGVTVISYNTFCNCRNLSSIVIPNSVTEIGSWAFAGCTGLKSIYLGTGIEDIDSYTFDDCTSLETITVCSTTPPFAYHAFSSFDSTACSKITLRVPKGSKSEYENSSYWKNMNIVEFDVYNVTLLAEGGNASFTGDGAYEAKEGAKAIVSTKPNRGYEFVKWSDGNTDNPRTISLKGDVTLKAFFAEKYYTVTLLVDDVHHGYITGETKVREGYYSYYNAVGVGGYVFDHWNDGFPYSETSLTITQDTTLKAFFKKAGMCQVTLSSADYVMGTVSQNTSCFSGEEVYITASYNDGHKFLQWSDGNANARRYVRVVSDTNLVAIFAPLEKRTVKFAVADSCKQMGKVVYNGKEDVRESDYVTAEAVAENGYAFHGWYYSDGSLFSSRADIYFYVDENVTLYARFDAKPDYAFVPCSGTEYVTLKVGDTITIYDSEGPDADYLIGCNGYLQLNGPAGYGIKISGTYNTERYRDGLVIYQSNAQNTDNRIASWYGSGTSTVLASDTVATIHFYSSTSSAPSSGFELKATLVKMLDLKDVPYNVAIASNDTALGNLNIDYIVKEGSSYQFGLSVERKRPGDFMGWSDNYSYYEWERLFEVYSDTTLTARFDTLKAYTVTIQSNDTTMGKIGGDQSGTYYEDEYISFKATPNNSDFAFVKWSDGNTNKSRGFYVTKDTTLVAEFKARTQCTVKIMVSDTTYGYGSSQTYYIGDNAWVSAYTKNNGFVVGWTDGVQTDSRRITVTGDTTLTAIVEPMPYKVDIHSNDTAMGSVNYSLNNRFNEYIYGAYMNAYAKPGYVFKCWSDGFVNSYRDGFHIISDTTVVAIFEPVKYKINIVCENGIVSTEAYRLDDSTIAYECYASANEGYCFAGWHDGYQLRNRTFAVGGDTTLTAKFVKYPYKVTLVYDDKKGSASYSTQSATLEKPMVNLRATEKPGYGFSHWKDSKGDISYSKSFSWTLSSDVTVEAVFEELPIKAMIVSNDTAMGTVWLNVSSWDSTYTYMNFSVDQVKKGYHFVMWSDNELSMYRYGTFETDTTITAIFAPNLYKIVATAKDASMGSVSAPDSAAFNSTITLTAKAASGYNFVKWSDGNTSNPRNVTVNGEMKFEAIFEKATAVEESAASSVNIYAYQNVIVVENAEAQISIYNAMGNLVATSNDANAEIKIQGTGIYIVKVGNIVERVMIND